MEIDSNTIKMVFHGELIEEGKTFRYAAYEKLNSDLNAAMKNNFLWRSVTISNEAGDESQIIWNPLVEALRPRIIECAKSKNWL